MPKNPFESSRLEKKGSGSPRKKLTLAEIHAREEVFGYGNKKPKEQFEHESGGIRVEPEEQFEKDRESGGVGVEPEDHESGGIEVKDTYMEISPAIAIWYRARLSEIGAEKIQTEEREKAYRKYGLNPEAKLEEMSPEQRTLRAQASNDALESAYRRARAEGLLS